MQLATIRYSPVMYLGEILVLTLTSITSYFMFLCFTLRTSFLLQHFFICFQLFRHFGPAIPFALNV